MTSIEEQVKNISLKAEDIKVTIHQIVHREYNDLLPSKSQHELLNLIKPLLGQVNKLDQKFENELQPKIKAATTQHKDLLDEFNKTRIVTHFLQKICLCHSELILCKSCESNQFVKCATHLQTVKTELESLNPSSEIKIFKAVRNEYINQQTRVVNTINDVWLSILNWNMSPNLSWDSMNGHLKTSLKIDMKTLDNSIQMADVLQAMDILQSLHPKLKMFSQKLHTYLLKPLIKFQALTPVMEEKENCFTLKLTKKKIHSDKFTKATANVLLYKKVLDVIRFVKNSLFKNVDTENSTKHLEPMSAIGTFIWKELSESIIKDHLSLSVPSSNSQMEKYESTIGETLQFENDLRSEGFIPDDEDVLSKYIKDANVHFANKVCQDILSEARYIILTEMHNTIEVGVMNDRAAIAIPTTNTPNKEGEILNKKIKNILMGIEAVEDDFLQINTFAFPSCHISDCVQKLMDFVYQTMIKATESPYPMASQMVYSCRDIFDLFVNVVPTYHQANLKLPQLAALHFNNCMYLAHHCITLGHQFQNSLPGQLNSSSTTFVDLVPVLRKCGIDCFLEQLRSQQKEILNLLEPCEQFTQVVTINGSEIVKRSFNQIIHHLTRVAKQWEKVLPNNIFKQSLSVLINTALEYCLSAVLKMEDISADEAGQMHTLFTILIDRVPEIVRDCTGCKGEDFVLKDLIRSYSKFDFVIKILEASLQEIVDMWHGGEGSLATCMSENEARTMIRALFQNTERRSQALAKIKHQQSSMS